MPKISIQQGHIRTGLSEQTIRRYIGQGLLPAYRLGTRLIRIDTDDLDALVRPVSTDSQPGRMTARPGRQAPVEDLEAYVKRRMRNAPPLTEHQKARLAVLFRTQPGHDVRDLDPRVGGEDVPAAR